jgi:hypothetical protein
MSKWAMQAHFKHLSFNNFLMIFLILKMMGFDPYNRALRIRESIGTPTSNMEFHGGVTVHSLTLFGTSGSMWCDF